VRPPRQPAQGLSQTQRSTLRDIVCGMAIALMEQGVPGMEALHDRHSPQTLAQKRKEDGEALRQTLDDLMGQFTGEELNLDADSDDPEAMLHAAMEQLRERARQEDAERQARAEARQARQAARQAKKGATAKQQQAAQALKDADTSLRHIYRQLASALHPDREPDPAERQRKNALMGEANAAYERKDLVALLRLQLQAELVDPDHLERVSDERLQHLTLLLKQRGRSGQAAATRTATLGCHLRPALGPVAQAPGPAAVPECRSADVGSGNPWRAGRCTGGQ